MECPRCEYRTTHAYALFDLVAHLTGDSHYVPTARAWAEASPLTPIRIPRHQRRAESPLAGRRCDICGRLLEGLQRMRCQGECRREHAHRVYLAKRAAERRQLVSA